MSILHCTLKHSPVEWSRNEIKCALFTVLSIQQTENDEQQRQCTTFNQPTFPQPFHLSPIFPKFAPQAKTQFLNTA